MGQAELILMGQDSTDPVVAGREAWESVKQADKGRQYYWAKIGAALLQGRQYCESDECAIEGKTANHRFGAWCDQNGFGDMDRRYRTCAMQMGRILIDTQRCQLNILDEITNAAVIHWVATYRKQYPDHYAELFPPRKKQDSKPKAIPAPTSNDPVDLSAIIGKRLSQKAGQKLLGELESLSDRYDVGLSDKDGVFDPRAAEAAIDMIAKAIESLPLDPRVKVVGIPLVYNAFHTEINKLHKGGEL